MANRDALRELQARLASRLQAAKTEGMSVAWLAVQAGARKYLFPLGQSGEIVPVSHLQAVPYSVDWFLGVMNIRGGLFGVVDLAAYLAQDGVGSRQVVAGEPSVVTLNAALDVNCALQVDVLSGLRGADAFTQSHGPAEGSPPYLGNVFIDSAGESWQEINLRVLSQSPQFLSITA
ncbi:CheW Chemotaxis signal transduction protein [Comamonadaceae bacterium]|jgi:twitching motility protein PilI|uniref:Chemotaxis protein CheW n=1 Tax=Rhodoferax potami TaxID=3068338 RepID=A0ABU3KPH0_9BURK|nr:MULTISPECIES: chemotaxis protein CheW [unclassified Rhodoferax]MDT7519473.1 chemotaxis protein CheW [Rhodoferax sp. TBRC 17660]MDZ7891146.1 chemotaxis protein CheW [Rhodoferax sp.]